MKIGIDIDDVLAAFNSGFINYYNKTFATNYRYEDLSDYNYSVLIKDIDPDTIFERVFEFVYSPDFEQVETIKGSQEGINSLKGNQLYVITSRSTDIQDSTLNWLNKNFTGFEDVIFTNSFTQNKTLKAEKKSEVGRRLGIEFMVEDAIHHAEDLAYNGIKVALLDAPWNRSMKDHELVTRAKTWNDVIKQING